jgi:hypothetical protein
MSFIKPKDSEVLYLKNLYRNLNDILFPKGSVNKIIRPKFDIHTINQHYSEGVKYDNQQNGYAIQF